MIMRVGPYLYRVQSVHGYIHHKGRKCLGLSDNDRHVLLVSDAASEAQQVQIVCHEYVEAWLHHFGGELKDMPCKEAVCDLMGMAMTQFALDFIRQTQSPDQSDDRATMSAPAKVSMLKEVSPPVAVADTPENTCQTTRKNNDLSRPSQSINEHPRRSSPRIESRWRVRVFESNPQDRPASAVS